MSHSTSTPPPLPQQLRSRLSEVSARDVLPESWELLSINAADTIASAFQKLSEKNVYTVPVFDESAGKFVGFLGLSDISHSMVHFFQAKAKLAHPDLADDPHKLLAASCFDHAEAEHIRHKVFHQTVSQLVNASGMNAWKAVSDSSSLQEVIDVLVSEKLARVPLVNAEGRVTAIVSGSAIVRYLGKRVDELGGELLDATLDTLLKPTGLLEPSDMEESTIACFAKLDSHKATHLPLSSQGKPQGNLSVKDIREATEPERLVQSVGDFVSFVRQKNTKAVHPFIHANTSDSFGKTLGRFVATGVHSMYLTDMPREQLDKTATYPPVGAITLHNILAVFAQQ